MIDKAKLIEWLKSDSVVVVSADVDGVPGMGEIVTVSLTNADPGHVLEGANRVTVEEETPESIARKAAEAKKIQDGWEE